MKHAGWIRLAIMVVASFAAMYGLMYVMVDRFSNIYPNVNQFYMATVMTGAMVVIELAVMGSMYKSKLGVFIVAGVAAVALAAAFTFTRIQFAVSDTEFLKSMIPHHGAAILMCEKAQLEDPEVQQLCRDILDSQQAQIDFMKLKLQTLPK